MVMINPTPGQPDTPNGAPTPTPNFSGQLPSLLGGVASGIIGSVTGLKSNTFNIILNTLFYAGISVGGMYLLYRGLMAIVTEIPGASGAGSYLGGTIAAPVKRLGSLGVSAGTFAATDGLSAVGSGFKTAGRVTKRKVVGGAKDFFLGPVEGPARP
jgi:hypothetical protein